MRIVTVKTATYEPSSGFFASPPVVLDVNIAPFQVTCLPETGTAQVQVSVADPYPKVNGKFVEQTNFEWFNAPTTSPNAIGYLGQPYTAVRLVSAVQNETLTVIQAGIK